MSKASAKEPDTKDIEFKGFVLGKLGIFTSTRNIVGGFSAYFGGHKNNIGLGGVVSYEISQHKNYGIQLN